MTGQGGDDLAGPAPYPSGLVEWRETAVFRA